jgi:hypothetical protein
MKMKWLVLGSLLVLCACEKKNKDAVTGLIPNSCNYTALQLYTGAITPMVMGGGQTQIQTIAIQADVIASPYDRVTVTLCRNADCDTVVPAIGCSTLPPGDPTPCIKTMPSINIGMASHQIKLVNAGAGGGAGYDHYLISESLCQ